ncbi:Chaperone protein ClpD, chloroplastic [Canna indica]|uniref:Chaperone protein ClpD, chloroplastic n=1 Tax=Canna indica TaxID=4628 RepID=A0AAQ3K430_9LILI|nr:Chaperone protein ClpD, chloroplastic [Canna indica]
MMFFSCQIPIKSPSISLLFPSNPNRPATSHRRSRVLPPGVSAIADLVPFNQPSTSAINISDEVHTLIGSGVVGRGNNASGLDIGNLLKPSLGRGELQVGKDPKHR